MPKPLHRVLSLKQLRLVSLLGAELNLSRCAQALHISQPAASRALAQLEAELGVRLFERTTKRMWPTAAGQSLIQHADRIVAELDMADAELAGLLAGEGGEAHIGVLQQFSAALVAQALQAASQRLPEARFHTHTRATQDLYDALLAGQIDLMLCHAEFHADLEQVRLDPLYQEFNAVVARRQHPLTDPPAPGWAALAAQRWVLPPPDTALRPKLDHMLAMYRTPRHAARPDVQTDSPQVALKLVRDADMLWSTANSYALDLELNGLVTRLPAPDPLLSGPMCCFSRRQQPLKTPARVFLQCLQAACATPA